MSRSTMNDLPAPTSARRRLSKSCRGLRTADKRDGPAQARGEPLKRTGESFATSSRGAAAWSLPVILVATSFVVIVSRPSTAAMKVIG
jgi:hypothetical protein